MKLICTQENLSQAIGLTARISSARASLPILGSILLSTEKGRLKISSTDLEIGISTLIGAKVDKEGGIAVPARLIGEFVSTNTDKNISLEVENETLALKSDRHSAHIKGQPSAEFPIIPEIKPDCELLISGAVLQEAIEQTVFSAASDDARPVLTGVLFKSEGSLLKVVATDSFRLAEKTVNLSKPPAGGKKAAQFLIPSRSLQEVSRILAGSNNEVSLSFSSNQVQFVSQDTTLVSRLLDGEFPDYIQIIPTQSATQAIVSREEAIAAIKMASFFARESNNNIKLKIGKENQLQVISASPQLGDNISQLKASTHGEEVEVSFNAKLLLGALSAIEEENVRFEFNGINPGILKPEKAKDYLYVIMPLRLEE